MTGDRITPSTHVDDIARLLSDEGSCTHNVWSGSRYGGPGRAVVHGRDPSDGSDGHYSVVRETAGRLEKRGDDVFPAFRNGFEATGSVSGARIVGRPDIIARHADGSVTVYDVRTGEPGDEDEVRVKLCMYLLPRCPTMAGGAGAGWTGVCCTPMGRRGGSELTRWTTDSRRRSRM